MYPGATYPRVVVVIDNAPWHRGKPIDEALRDNSMMLSSPPKWSARGKPIDEALRDNPHLEFQRLPSYRPQLNPIERFWKKLRRRATHNRLFDTLTDLKTSLRASLSSFQTVRHKVESIIRGRPKLLFP
jgi:transposase